MLPTNASRVLPIFDDFGLFRGTVNIIPGREFESTQLANRVVVAVAYVLGERVEDWTQADPERACVEIARRAARRAPGLKDQIIGVLEIADQHEPFVLVAVYRGREKECQAIATLANATVSRFLHRMTHVLAYEL